MTGILDYGTGNLRSVQKAFEFLGERAEISSETSALDTCDRLILPGVGSFGQGMAALRARGLDIYVKSRAKDTPVLGICLGMQFLLERSFEDGENTGLGFCRGDVVRFSSGKVPQIGWNGVFSLRSPLFEGLEEGSEFYFVHSYYAAAGDFDTIAKCEYGVRYAAGGLERAKRLRRAVPPRKERGRGAQTPQKFSFHQGGEGMKLFPAIDILGGRAVRLLYGKRELVTDYGLPLDRAKRWRDAGAEWLHVVDLDGAFDGGSRADKILSEIVALGIKVQSGGGSARWRKSKVASKRAFPASSSARYVIPTPRFSRQLSPASEKKSSRE